MSVMHPMLKAENMSSYSSLVSALEGHRVRGSFVEDTFLVPRASKGALLKPISPWPGQTRITFESMPRMYGGRGLPISLLRGGLAPGNVLRNPSEPVFASGSPRSSLTLRVSWPGYVKVDSVKQLPISPSATRLDIAMLVIEQYSRMFERARLEPGCGGWTIGKGAIALDSLVLVSVSNDVEDVFEAEMCVVFSRNDPTAMMAASRR